MQHPDIFILGYYILIIFCHGKTNNKTIRQLVSLNVFDVEIILIKSYLSIITYINILFAFRLVVRVRGIPLTKLCMYI